MAFASFERSLATSDMVLICSAWRCVTFSNAGLKLTVMARAPNSRMANAWPEDNDLFSKLSLMVLIAASP